MARCAKLLCFLTIYLKGAGTILGDRKNENDQSLVRFDMSQIVSMHLHFYRGHIGGSERRTFRSPFVGFLGTVPLVAQMQVRRAFIHMPSLVVL